MKEDTTPKKMNTQNQKNSWQRPQNNEKNGAWMLSQIMLCSLLVKISL